MRTNLDISIITVVYNNAATIADCINSVASQKYPYIEHIVVDGDSTDGTQEVIRKNAGRIAKFISEPDLGIYDAMNKGIKSASGDIVGILNSDDIYRDSKVISTVAEEFEAKQLDSVFADLVIVNKHNLNKIVRYYDSSKFVPSKLALGCMPAHPTFFARRSCYEQYGLFNTDYKIASDFELLARFFWKHHITYSYISEVLVKMRSGGLSTRSLRSNLILNREIVRACAENDIKTNYLMVYSKYLTKMFQLVRRPR